MIEFGGHRFHDREDGLLHCKVCGGAEGTLPAECPGERMLDDVASRVWAGELDYRDGRWVEL